uniref:VWFC domain-containing protein n=1 Tax=Oryzias latipes TaxID=8090 RepID=A0A3B3HMS7_ORYLA
DGEAFPNPVSVCEECRCQSGRIDYPPADCEFEQRFYRHMERFFHPNDNCRSCACNNGTVQCHRKPCPSAPCTHSIPQDCCPHCDSCLYEGVIHAHTHTFTPSFDPCWRCTCVRGTVSCVPRDCPPTVCAHPVVRPGHCCPECSGCVQNERRFTDGQSWSLDRCTVCTCQVHNCLSPLQPVI